MPERSSSDRFETRPADETGELVTTKVRDQDPDIIEIAELEDPLDHPECVLHKVGCFETGVPKKTIEPLDDLGLRRFVVLGFLSFESDDELATQGRGQLLEDGDFET